MSAGNNNTGGPSPSPPPRPGGVAKLFLDNLGSGGGWGLGDGASRLPAREEQQKYTIYSIAKGGDDIAHESDVSSTSAAGGGGGSTSGEVGPSPPPAAAATPTPSPSPAAAGHGGGGGGGMSNFAAMMAQRAAGMASRAGGGAASASPSPPQPAPMHTQAYAHDVEDDDDNTFIDYGPRGGAGEAGADGIPNFSGIGGGTASYPAVPSTSRPSNPQHGGGPSPSNGSKPPMAPPSLSGGGMPYYNASASPPLNTSSPQSQGVPSPAGRYTASPSTAAAEKELPVELVYDHHNNWRPGTIVSSLLLPSDLPFRTMAMVEGGLNSDGSSASSLWVSMGNNEPISMFDLSGCELNAQRNVGIVDVSAMAVVTVRTMKMQPVGEKFKESRASQGLAAAAGASGGGPSGMGARGGRGGTGFTPAGGRGGGVAAATALAAASIAAHQKQQKDPQCVESSYLWCGTEKGAIAFVDLDLCNEDGVLSNAHNEAITFMYCLPQSVMGGGGTMSRVWTCSARDRQLKVWDGATRRALAKKVLAAPVTDCVALPADVVPHVWTSSGEASVRVWDYDGKERTHSRFPPNSNALRFKAEVRFVRYHPLTQLMWVCCVSCVMLVNPKTYEVLQSLPIIALALEFGTEQPQMATVIGFCTLDGKSRPPAAAATAASAAPTIITVECPYSSGRVGNDASFTLTREMVTVGQRLADINGFATPVGATCQWPGFKVFGRGPYAAVPHTAANGASYVSVFTTETCEPVRGWGGGLFGAANNNNNNGSQQQITSSPAASGQNTSNPNNGAPMNVLMGSGSVMGGALGSSAVFGNRSSIQGPPPRGTGSVMGGSAMGRPPYVGKPAPVHSVFQQALRPSNGAGAGGGPSVSGHSMIKPLARAGGDGDKDGASTEGTFVVHRTPHGSVMGGAGGGHSALFGGGGGGGGGGGMQNAAASVASFNGSVVIHRDAPSDGGAGAAPQWMAMLNPQQQQQSNSTNYSPPGGFSGASGGGRGTALPPGATAVGAGHAVTSGQQQQQRSGAASNVPASHGTAMAATMIDPALAKDIRQLSEGVKAMGNTSQLLKDFTELSTFAQAQRFRLVTIAGSAAVAEESEEALAMAQQLGLPRLEVPEARVIGEVLTYMTVRAQLLEAERSELAARCAALEKALVGANAVSSAVAEATINSFGIGGGITVGGSKHNRTITIPQQLFNAYLTASVTASAASVTSMASIANNNTNSNVVAAPIQQQQQQVLAGSTRAGASMTMSGTADLISPLTAADFPSPATPAPAKAASIANGSTAHGGHTTNNTSMVLVDGSAPKPPMNTSPSANPLTMAQTGSPSTMTTTTVVVPASTALAAANGASPAASAAAAAAGSNGPANASQLATVAAAASANMAASLFSVNTANVRALQQLCTAQASHVQLLLRQNGSLQGKLRECEVGLARLESALTASVTTVLGPAMSSEERRKAKKKASSSSKEKKRSSKKKDGGGEDGNGNADDDGDDGRLDAGGSPSPLAVAASFNAYRKDIDKEIRRMRGDASSSSPPPSAEAAIGAAFGHASNAMVKLVWMAQQYGAAIANQANAQTMKAAMLGYAAASTNNTNKNNSSCNALNTTALAGDCSTSSSKDCGASAGVAVTNSAARRAALIRHHTAAVAQMAPLLMGNASSSLSAVGMLSLRDRAELLRSVVHPMLGHVAEVMAQMEARRTTALDALRLTYDQGARRVLSMATSASPSSSVPLPVLQQPLQSPVMSLVSPSGAAVDGGDASSSPAASLNFITKMITACDVTTMLVVGDASFAANMSRLCLQEALFVVLEGALHELVRCESEEGYDGEGGGGGGGGPFAGGAAVGPTTDTLRPSMRGLNAPLVVHVDPNQTNNSEDDDDDANEVAEEEKVPAGGAAKKQKGSGGGGLLNYADPAPLQHSTVPTGEEMERCSSTAIAIGVELEALVAKFRGTDVTARRRVTEKLEEFVASLSSPHRGAKANNSSGAVGGIFGIATPAEAVGGMLRLYVESTNACSSTAAATAAVGHEGLPHTSSGSGNGSGSSSSSAGICAKSAQWRLCGALGWASLWARFIGEALTITAAVVAAFKQQQQNSILSAASAATEASDACPPTHPSSNLGPILTAEHVMYLLDLLTDWRAIARELESELVLPLLAAVADLDVEGVGEVLDLNTNGTPNAAAVSCISGGGANSVNVSNASSPTNGQGDDGGAAEGQRTPNMALSPPSDGGNSPLLSGGGGAANVTTASASSAACAVMASPMAYRLFSLYLRHMCTAYAAVGVGIQQQYNGGATVAGGVPALLQRYPPTYQGGGSGGGGSESADASAAQQRQQVGYDIDPSTSPAAYRFSPEACGIRKRRGGGPADGLSDYFAVVADVAAEAKGVQHKLHALGETMHAFEEGLKALLGYLTASASSSASAASLAVLPIPSVPERVAAILEKI